MTAVDINIWHDEISGGWILEIRAIGNEWYRFGVYGSRQAAKVAIEL